MFSQNFHWIQFNEQIINIWTVLMIFLEFFRAYFECHLLKKNFRI